MALDCLSVKPYTAPCELIVGGVDSLYAVSFKDLTGATSVYTVSTGGTISAIGLATSKKFVKVDLVAETANIEENFTSNIQNGTGDFTTTLNLVVNNFTNDSRTFVESLAGKSVAFLVKMKSGRYTFIGGNGQGRVATIKNGSGTAGTDRNGYEISITSKESELLREVDSTLVSTLI